MKTLVLIIAGLLGSILSSHAQKIVIKGSNTFGEELGPRLIEVYTKARPEVTFELEHKGTTSGILGLLDGECDIAAASRPAIEDEERLARSRKIELSHYVIGYYGASVIINAANHVRNLSDAQVRDIFSGKIANWKDLGGDDAPIHLYIRDAISGVYLGFQELAMERRPYAEAARPYRSYGEIANAVNTDPLGIGYTGINIELRDKIKVVSINGQLATPDAITNGTYPYARELRFYVNKPRLSDAGKEFIRFVKSGNGQSILASLGFVRRNEPKVWPPAPE